jgi:molybdenum cofactor synthesis domain-containing protein
VKAAVLTISTSKAAGDGDDESGPALASFAEGLGLEVVAREVVPDELEGIRERLLHWSDEEGCELILTTGGTGLAPTDVTPEAIRMVIQREAPGIAEAMRLESREHTRHWMLSRGVAGVRGSTLIVSFPGSPKSIAEAGAAIAEALPHALKLIAGEQPHPRP